MTLAMQASLPAAAPHPQDVVIAPLDVDLMVVHQVVEDDVRAGTAVVDVADDMQSLDGEALNQFGEVGDEGLRAAGRHDGVDLALVVGGFVLDALLVVKQLLDGLRNVLGQQVAHRLAPILGAQSAAEFDQANQRQAAPLVLVGNRLQHHRRFELGVVDERRQIAALLLGHGVCRTFRRSCAGSIRRRCERRAGKPRFRRGCRKESARSPWVAAIRR